MFSLMNEMVEKESMVIKFSDGVKLGGIVSTGGQDLNSE